LAGLLKSRFGQHRRRLWSFFQRHFEDDGTINFDGDVPPFRELKRHYTDQDALGFAQFVEREKYYLDVHCTVWTPESFVDVFSQVITLGQLNCEITGPIDGFVGNGPEEFLVYLQKNEPTKAGVPSGICSSMAHRVICLYDDLTSRDCLLVCLDSKRKSVRVRRCARDNPSSGSRYPISCGDFI